MVGLPVIYTLSPLPLSLSPSLGESLSSLPLSLPLSRRAWQLAREIVAWRSSGAVRTRRRRRCAWDRERGAWDEEAAASGILRWRRWRCGMRRRPRPPQSSASPSTSPPPSSTFPSTGLLVGNKHPLPASSPSAASVDMSPPVEEGALNRAPLALASHSALGRLCHSSVDPYN